MPFDNGDVRDAGGDRGNLRSSHLRMGCFAPAEAHLYLHLVSVFEKTSSGAHADLQVVFVGARSQSDLLDLRNMLILLRVARAFVLFEPESSQVRDATHGRVRGRGDFDQV
jgi:hypothetical protein